MLDPWLTYELALTQRLFSQDYNMTTEVELTRAVSWTWNLCTIRSKTSEKTIKLQYSRTYHSLCKPNTLLSWRTVINRIKALQERISIDEI